MDFKAFANNAPVAIRTFDRELRHVYVNAECSRLYGKEAGSILGKSMEQAGLPEAQCRFWEENVLKVFQSGQQTQLSDYIDVKEVKRFLRSHLLPEYDDDGRVATVTVISEDTTELKHAEEALRKSEERLSFALETARIGAWDLDLVNHAADRSLLHDEIFGYKDLLPTWTYEMFLGHVLPEDRAEVDRHFRQAVGSSGDWNFECRIRRTDGEIRWIWAAGRHRSGAARSMSGIVQDITERKLAQESLQDKYREFAAIFERSIVGKGEVNPVTGRFLRVNQALADLTGYSIAELCRMTFTDITHPDDRQRDLEIFAQVRSGLAESWQSEKRYLRKDGSIIWVNVAGNIIRYDDGRPVRTIAVVQDITDRKRAEDALKATEAELRRAQRLAHIGNWYWDAKNNVTTGSDELFRIFGSDPAANHTMPKFEEQRGRRYPVEDWELIKSAVQKSLETGAGYELDVRAVCNGKTIWVTTRGEVVRDTNDQIVGLRGTVQDITDRKQAEDAIREANATLEQKVLERTTELTRRAAQLRILAGELTLTEQRERRRLARVLHDHLQQLLVAAKFRVAILGRGGDDLIKQAAKEVEELIDASISASRSLTGELSPPILHEEGLNAGLQWLARRLADTQGLFVNLEMEEIGNLPEEMKILLFESVRELLFNVVKHAQTRSATISLRIVDGSLQLTVSDQGIGFNPDEVRGANESGGGFGLFSVRERLELFEGQFEIQSAPGQGTRVVLSVPIATNATAEPTRPVKL